MPDLKKTICNQISSNQGKNLFTGNMEIFRFISDTVKAMPEAGKISRQEEEDIINFTTEKALEEFCRMNQYYSFDSEAKNELKRIYGELFAETRTNPYAVEEVSRRHYSKLKSWLTQSNPFAEKIYEQVEATIDPVACSDYSPELQLRILHLDVARLTPPLLDIGCGKEGNLVRYLKSIGIEAFGIDRNSFIGQSGLLTADWLEFDYGLNKWGTITSHLGFSNHFIHHNLCKDGNFDGYAQTYMNILHSLVPGGCFHYAPELPFIEKYLEPAMFEVKKYEIMNCDFRTTLVRRQM